MFDSTELQAVNAAVSEKNDIVPALPLELILQIFSHLHIQDAWSLQLVNRKWHKTLSSEVFLRTALARWDTHDPSDSGRSVDAIAKDTIRDRDRHMHALKHARPFTVAHIEDSGSVLPGLHPQLSQSKFDLKGDLVAYISSQFGNGDAVVIRNLITGALSTLRGDARERILSVILTTSVVAFVTFDGCLYVAQLSDKTHWPSTTRIQLPSSLVRGSGGHNGTVVLAMGETGSGSGHVTEVLIYDATERRLRSLPLVHTQQQREGNVQTLGSCSVLVDSNTSTIDVLTLALPLEPSLGRRYKYHNLQLNHQRISFEGEMLCADMRRGTLESNIYDQTRIMMAPPQPTGYAGLYRLQVGESSFTGPSTEMKLHFLFDVKDGSFVHSDSCRTPCVLGFTDVEQIEAIEDAPDACVTWKDTALALMPNECTHWNKYGTLINDTFLVCLDFGTNHMPGPRIRVFCFDEKVHMQGARSTFIKFPVARPYDTTDGSGYEAMV